MKSIVLSLVLLLAVGGVGSGPAAASVSIDNRDSARRDRSATFQDAGSHLQRMRVARATINDSFDTWSRRSRSDEWSEAAPRKRYTQRKSTRSATKAKRKTYANRPGGKVAARSSERKTATVRKPRSLSTNGPSGGLAQLFGMASFYWQPQRLATGGWFNPNAMTAAHKTLPFGTRVRVTHLGNGRSVDVKINDRGPYIAGRIIDLSKAAAGVIGMQGQGVAKVKVTVLGRG